MQLLYIKKNILKIAYIMLTQEDLEEFFYTIIGEMRDLNIPILNNFQQRFGDFKYSFEIEEEEKEIEDDDEDPEPNETVKKTDDVEENVSSLF
jgi:hypothetical protein